MKFEEKNNSGDEGSKGQNHQNMNDFLLLSKVATMCNQLSNEEKMLRKEKTEKEAEEEKEFDELKFKSKKM